MIKNKTDVEKGIAALIALTAIFASLSVLARYLSTDFTILQQVYLRVFAALAIAAVVFRKRIRWGQLSKLPMREWLILAFRGFVSYAIGVTLISKAANMTLLGHVAFIGALPFVPLLGFLFLKEKVTSWKMLFICGALLGVSLLSVHSFSDLLSWNTGDLLAIIATLGFALGYITRKWHGDTLNNQEITLLTFVFGGIFVLLLSILLGEGIPEESASWAVWAVVAFGGVLNVVNLLLTNYAFEYVDAVRAGSLLNLESAWGLLFGLVLYHEWPSLQGLAGGLLIVASAVMMNIYSHREVTKLAAIEEDLDT
jgi:drug/metabolite transporter (DMT)-like permease